VGTFSRAARRSVVPSRAKLLRLAAVPALFALGWLTATVQRGRPAAAAEVGAVAQAPAPSVACVDDDAMQANANLVRQLAELNARAQRLEGDVVTAETRARVQQAPPPPLSVPSAEWTRMREAKMLRLRTPCGSWDGRPRVSLRTPTHTRMSIGGHGGLVSMRAESAGLAPEELTAVEDAYKRAHARTWGKMRAACTDVVYSRSEAPDNDAERLATCANRKLRVRAQETQRAMDRVAELRAAGASVERATTDEERILGALAESSDALAEELVHALGREKAARAVDYGIVCLDETTYMGERPKSGA
jgi:hypothetical protein